MADFTVYPKSRHEDVFMTRDAQGVDFLMDGAQRRELTHETACWLRQRFPWTAPQPVLRRERTVGVGDRLGIACPGHLRVFEKYDATPVLAQQSIRELNLTSPSPFSAKISSAASARTAIISSSRRKWNTRSPSAIR